MSKGKQRDRRKERQWRRWLREWRSSGTTVRLFCEAVGVSEASFYFWRRELERRSGEKPAFVPVRVLADATTTGAPATALEIVVADRRAVRVPIGFDAETLRRVLAVLEEKPC